MRLQQLLTNAGIENNNYSDCEIKDIITDSRKAVKDTAFVCIVGFKSDGHDFAREAYDAGVRVFFAQRELGFDDATVIICDDTSIILAKLSYAFFGNPAEKIKLIGVTGTKGKTTVTSLIYTALNKNGKRAGLIGTVGIFYNNEYVYIPNTTPDSYTLNKYLAKMAEAGVEYAVMEVSSQAYLNQRVYGLTFDVGVFTNISPDHIGPGESDSFEHYLSLKQMLIKNSKAAFINRDDEHYQDFAKCAKGELFDFSCEKDAKYTAENFSMWKDDTSFGITFDVCADKQKYNIKTHLPGKYNMSNMLCVFAVCDKLGIERKKIAKAISEGVVPGRFEVIKSFSVCPIIIDYAHNEVSLESLLKTVREYNPERLVVLFGCVGGKSKMRRAAMAHVVNRFADFAIITSDNPDFENPDDIISDIVSEINTDMCKYKAIADRREAIIWAMENARRGDILLLAGKGHEDYQLICGEKVPFSERDIIEETIKLLPVNG